MFEVLGQDQDSKARHGRLTTAHGVIETPAFMPVGTQGSVKAVSPRELRELKAQIILGNVLSLGTGTDGLQHVACHGLMAEADWTHGNNEQCADRLDRGGQTRTVQFDIFVAPGSLSEKVLAASLRDAAITEKALDRRVDDIL